MAIGRVDVNAERFNELWGVTPQDYTLSGSRVDLQDLLVVITQQRASAIEAEVTPLQNIITKRNERLTKESAVLQKLTELQATYTTDVTTATVSLSGITSTCSLKDFWTIMASYGMSVTDYNASSLTLTKAQCEGYVSRCKNSIDQMNNDSQTDMTRLQSLVDRRDESYSTATSLMTSVSDTRSTLIKQL